MSYDAKQHSYEEIRGAIVDVLVRSTPPEQWIALLDELADEFARRQPTSPNASPYHGSNQLHPYDRELARDAFWDLFRQGMITLGVNDSNPNWPWFRLSHLGQKELAAQSPLRFYDPGTFLGIVKREVPDVSEGTLIYLQEAAGAFYANLLLSACVMLGVAAEAELIRLVEVAAAHPVHGNRFNAALKAEFVGSKAGKFQKALDAITSNLPKEATEHVEILSTIQAVIRAARNNAGHPVVTSVSREQVYVLLQLFVPMARQMRVLRRAFS